MPQATTPEMRDFLTREYLPVIQQFSEDVQQSLLHESAITLVRVPDSSKRPPSAPASDELPKELAFLAGPLCDLGFEKLDLPPDEIERIFLAFCGQGVGVPGTRYRLRHSVMSLFTFVEPAMGNELKLPDNWREAVRSSTTGGRLETVGCRWIVGRLDAFDARHHISPRFHPQPTNGKTNHSTYATGPA